MSFPIFFLLKGIYDCQRSYTLILIVGQEKIYQNENFIVVILGFGITTTRYQPNQRVVLM